MSSKVIYAPAAEKFANHNPEIDGHTCYERGEGRTPFVYLLVWKIDGKISAIYCGSRYAANCHPSDLWSTYFTSSEYVYNHIKDFGEPSDIIIRMVYTNIRRTLRCEYKHIDYLKKLFGPNCLNVRTSCWGSVYNPHEYVDYNNTYMTKGTMVAIKAAETRKTTIVEYDGEYITISEKAGRILSETLSKYNPETGLTLAQERGKKVSKTIIESGSRAGENHHMWGKAHSEETKSKIRESSLGRTHSDETKQKMSESHSGENHHYFGVSGEGHPKFGKKLSKEAKSKIADSSSNRIHINNGKVGTFATFEEANILLNQGWVHGMLSRREMELECCPYCGKEGRGGNMKRYHFDNCNSNPDKH